MHQRTIITALSALALAAAAVGCRGGRTDRAYRTLTGGTEDRGHQLILMKNCGSCHTIPGIRGARGQVGPPLTLFAERSYIAGELPNTPDNVVKWVRSPQSVEPKTAMPNLGLSDQQARDVAAYLYTLR